jgi:hypothetical protein
MRTGWQRFLGWLGIILLLGTIAPGAEIAAQSESPFGDPYREWGMMLRQREASRLGREDTIAKYNYCPTGGCVVRLESVEVRPNRARKGETLKLITSYSILTPEQIAIPVVTSREILFQGNPLGKTRDIATRKYNGTWVQEIDFALPENAAPGVYTLVTRINTGYGSDQKSTQFTVE